MVTPRNCYLVTDCHCRSIVCPAVADVKGGGNFEKLQEAVVPDVLDAVGSDVAKLLVKFSNGEANLGNELTPADTKETPEVDWTPESDKFYTLSMTDPDALSRQNPIYREWQHWLVVNIPGNNVKEGQTLADYIGPGPPKGTGLHRYIFLLYEQPKKIDFSEQYKGVHDMADRKNFNSSAFVLKHNLGNPVAGNYFFAKSQK
ncbi:protein D2-like isoform X2 [Lycorma delicatula]|uniref:protein D2-like isoform X2 n=1 Tax=Lycorma delicatula TaxID=130591 RepID=UPI003F51167E